MDINCEIFNQDGHKMNNLNLLMTYMKAKMNEMNKLEEELNHTKDKIDSHLKLLNRKEAQMASSEHLSKNNKDHRDFSVIKKPVQRPIRKK